MNHCAKILILSFFFALPQSALACSCDETTYEERINLADNIVYAVLIDAQIETGNWHYATAMFKVNTVYKGSTSETLVLRTPADFGVACGVPLTVGLHYLLLYKNESNYISSCSGSGVATPRHEEIVKKMLNGK